MQITCTQESGVQILKVGEQRIDASVAIQFKDKMRTETTGAAGPFVLDLSDVSFIDSSGLGAIVAALKQLDVDQTLALSGLTPAVDKVFRLTRMDKVFKIHDTARSAVRAHGL